MADSLPAALAGLHAQLLGQKPELEARIAAEQDQERRHNLRGDLNVIQMRIFGIEQYGIDVADE